MLPVALNVVVVVVTRFGCEVCRISSGLFTVYFLKVILIFVIGPSEDYELC